MLLTALAENPGTPALAAGQVADDVARTARVRDRTTVPTIWAVAVTGGGVLAHPHLDENHPALNHVALPELLRAMASPLLTDDRARLLLSRATDEDLGLYLREPDPHPIAFTLHRNIWAPGEPVTSEHRIIACHRAAPRDDAVSALASLVQYPWHNNGDFDSLVTAATRHPSELTRLAELATNRAVARQLASYATQADPYQARLDEVIAVAGAGATNTHWVHAIHTSPEPAVLAAALAHNPCSAMWTALREARLADTAKTPLMAVAIPSARAAGVLSAPPDAAFIARVATLETLAELAGTNLNLDTALLSRADLPADVIHTIVDQLDNTHARLRRRQGGLSEFELNKILVVAAGVSTHPNTPPPARVHTADLATRLAAQAETISRGATVDWAHELAQLAAAGRRLTTTTPYEAAQDLPAALLRSRATGLDGPGMHLLLRVTVTAHADDLADPDYTRALLTLAPDFAGTLGQLLHLARTIAA